MFRSDRLLHIIWSIILIVILLMTCITGIIYDPSYGSEPKMGQGAEIKFQEKTRSSSVSGGFKISEIASTRILGKDFPGPGGKLGYFSWMGDINEDGTKDLLISAKEAPGTPDESPIQTGEIYIWFGNDSQLPSNIDLESSTPDITIRGGHDYSFLLESFSVGYIDDDDYLDMILGIPSHPSAGRLFILWGKEGGWPQTIQLHDPGRLSPNGDPYGFERTQDYFIAAGRLAPVPYPLADYKTGDSVECGDIDGDGLEDVIFSSPGWNHVLILWGTQDRMDLANDYTIIQDDDPNGFFGDEVHLCDIDDDGNRDLIVGASMRSDYSIPRYQCGAVFVYNNISRTKDNETVDSFYYARPVIWGSDDYDSEGDRILIHDLDLDGKDDIISGFPGGDGPGDQRSKAGGLHIFQGDVLSAFPTEMMADQSADITILGSEGEKPEEPGDQIGKVFSVGDIDGDQMPEIVIGIPNERVDDMPNVGKVIGYDGNTLLDFSNGLVDLSIVEPLFVILGEDQEDVFGYSISTGDINNDGVDDIALSAPSADGISNMRSGCGEGFILMGTSLNIEEVIIQGTGSSGNIILPGKGEVILNVTYRHGLDASVIENGSIVLEPDGLEIEIGINNGTPYKANDPFDLVEIDQEGFDLGHNGKRGWLRTTQSLNWYFGKEGPMDIKVDLSDGMNLVTKTFVEVMDVEKTITLEDSYNLLRNGREVKNEGEWWREGDNLTITELDVHYEEPLRTIVPKGDFHLFLSSDDMELGSIDYHGPSTELTTFIPYQDPFNLSIEIGKEIGPRPDGLGKNYDINLVGMIDQTIDVDLYDPESPDEILLEADDGRYSKYDDGDGAWMVEWNYTVGLDMDGNGSGVKEYRLSVDGNSAHPVMSKGGLFGTYYDDEHFDRIGLERIDENLDFSLNDWGEWGPAPGFITPDRHSIRWHGWLKPVESRPYEISLSGSGMAKVFLDDQMLMDWKDVSSITSLPQRYLEENEPVSIEIYFIHKEGKDSAFSLLWRDDRNFNVPVPSSVLNHPTNRTNFTYNGGEGKFDLTLVSVDWVEKMSTTTTTTGIVDMTPPRFDTTSIPPIYFKTGQPILELDVMDPMMAEIQGSGIDLSSFRYRTKNDSQENYGSWKVPDVNLISKIDGPIGYSRVNFSFRAALGTNFRGSIIYKIEDAVGNEQITSSFDAIVDLNPPSFEVLEPLLGVQQKGPKIDFLLRVVDRSGSGVDNSTLEWRYGGTRGWSEWISVNTSNASSSGDVVTAEFSMLLGPGNYSVMFKGRDRVGNLGISSIFDLSVSVDGQNLPPVPVIKSPVDGAQVVVGYPILLDASGTTDDEIGGEPELTFTWYSDVEGFLATGNEAEISFSEVGSQKITLFVSDGARGNNVSTSVRIEVLPQQVGAGNDTDGEPQKKKDSNLANILIFSIIGVVILGLIALFLLSYYRRKSEEETQIEYKETTRDDMEYEEKILKEERNLGLNGDQEKLTEEETEEQRRRLYGNEE